MVRPSKWRAGAWGKSLAASSSRPARGALGSSHVLQGGGRVVSSQGVAARHRGPPAVSGTGRALRKPAWQAVSVVARRQDNLPAPRRVSQGRTRSSQGTRLVPRAAPSPARSRRRSPPRPRGHGEPALPTLPVPPPLGGVDRRISRLTLCQPASDETLRTKSGPVPGRRSRPWVAPAARVRVPGELDPGPGSRVPRTRPSASPCAWAVRPKPSESRAGGRGPPPAGRAGVARR